MNNLHYVDLSTSNEYDLDNNREDLITTTENSFESENDTMAQEGGFFWSNSGNSKNDKNFLLAARTKDYGVVDFMVNHDMVSNLSSKDDNGSNVLHYLAHDYSTNPKAKEVVSKLVSRSDISSFINAKNNNGDTPLISAVKAGNMDLAEKLISAGADKTLKNNDGLYVASEYSEGSDQQAAQQLTESVNSMVNMFVNMDGNLDTESPNMPDHLSLTETVQYRRPTYANNYSNNNDLSSSMSIKDTDAFLTTLENKYINNGMSGGSRKSGSRTLRYYNFDASYEGSANDSELSRMIENQASEIHKRVVNKIMDLMGVDEVAARTYKAMLYSKVKEEHPELNNLDRAIEMENMTTIDNLESLDKNKFNEIEKHIRDKDEQRASSASEEKPKKAKKTKASKSKDDKPKKATKKSSKSKKADTATSDAPVDAGIALSATSISDSDSSLNLSS